MRRPHALLPLLFVLPVCWGCSRPAGLFNDQNARAHVGMLAGTIGSRPIGSEANARARAYLTDQLSQYGFEVRVQETDSRRPSIGRAAHVANIIAVRQGSRSEAIGLVCHYDSVAAGPGAADDALGVAAALEAGRVLASRSNPTWTLMLLLTDGEEWGLMGAAALATDRDVMRRLATYINLDSIGAAGPPMLFEAGPGNDWLVGTWRRAAPYPRGGSFAGEIYRRLPNDTDFSVLKLHEIPGLNFAAVGDGYAYHTSRDTPERLSTATLRQTVTPRALLGRVSAINITAYGARPAGAALGGIVGTFYGAEACLAVAAAGFLIQAIVIVTSPVPGLMHQPEMVA